MILESRQRIWVEQTSRLPLPASPPETVEEDRNSLECSFNLGHPVREIERQAPVKHFLFCSRSKTKFGEPPNWAGRRPAPPKTKATNTQPRHCC